MRIAVGADDEGDLPHAVVLAHLREAGHHVEVPVPVGTAWPEVGRAVGAAVASGDADVGVVACWTGTGVSIAANKVPGVRAAAVHGPRDRRGRPPLERRQRARPLDGAHPR